MKFLVTHIYWVVFMMNLAPFHREKLSLDIAFYMIKSPSSKVTEEFYV